MLVDISNYWECVTLDMLKETPVLYMNVTFIPYYRGGLNSIKKGYEINKIGKVIYE